MVDMVSSMVGGGSGGPQEGAAPEGWFVAFWDDELDVGVRGFEGVGGDFSPPAGAGTTMVTIIAGRPCSGRADIATIACGRKETI
ncbi:hypothetical protein ABZ897_18315 [Nonomuraea sp. NPDC046802]|uniref:hypothetical protein n=1 Tax=Nonomuraea sp. NPDC046802 TaxID=3154919 RepID=UPI0033EE8E5E